MTGAPGGVRIKDVAAAAEAAGEPETAPAEPVTASVQSAAEAATEPATATVEEEDVSFTAVVDRLTVPKGEDRESEDYGEDEDEEYEIPTVVTPQVQRPAAIRFGEDLLGRQRAAEEEAAKAAPKKTRRPSRFNEEEEDDMDDIEYSGRIH